MRAPRRLRLAVVLGGAGLAVALGVALLVLAGGGRPGSRPAPRPTAAQTPQQALTPVPTPTPMTVPIAVIPRGRQVVHVPILMYHYIRVNPDPSDRIGFGLSVTPRDFEAQMSWLDANGYHPVDMTDLRAYFSGNADLPARPVVITFDDGSEDLYATAYPVLRAHHFKAVAYIVSGYLNARDRVTREQVLEMARNGIEIGSHTVSHLDLSTLPASRLETELVKSKAGLEELLGHPVVDFCYPAGRFNGLVVDAVRKAGYQSAVTTDFGTAHEWVNHLTWLRIRVSGGEPLDQFIANLGAPDPTVTVPQLVWPSPSPTPNPR